MLHFKCLKTRHRPLLALQIGGMNQEQITTRLQASYPDANIEVFDLTGAGNHWEINIATDAFKGLNRIQQHQAVMAVFGPELKTGEMHALSLKTKLKES